MLLLLTTLFRYMHKYEAHISVNYDNTRLIDLLNLYYLMDDYIQCLIVVSICKYYRPNPLISPLPLVPTNHGYTHFRYTNEIE